jgi:integrase
MTVKVRKRKDREGAFQVDIRGMLPDGTHYRERVKPPVTTASAALRWGQQREAIIIQQGGIKPRKTREPAPTLDAFMQQFRQGHIKAEMLKPSTAATIECLFRKHLQPAFGGMRLDEVDDAAVQALKGRLAGAGANPKSVNNVLAVLSRMLRRAVEWGAIDEMPCTIRLVKTPPSPFSFYDFGDYARLLDAARALDPRIELLILLGGDAGLRRGEILGLEWTDIDTKRATLDVQRSVYGKHVSSPKGGRSRRVPMTQRLAEALRTHRHLRGPRVLCHEDGAPLGKKALEEWMEKATRKAGLPDSRGLHALRHTFCSHLAMQGAPAKAIQELAGHADLTTTLRYMHLSPSVKDVAVRLLDQRPAGEPTGSQWHQAGTSNPGTTESLVQ